MSINDATPQDWDRVRETGEPTFEEYMKRLNSTWVYDSTRGTDPIVTADAVDFEDCWDNTPMERAIRSFKTKLMSTTGCESAAEAIKEISRYPMKYLQPVSTTSK